MIRGGGDDSACRPLACTWCEAGGSRSEVPILWFQKVPLFRGCFGGEFMTFAMIIVMTFCAVGFSVVGTLFINRHLPWMFGKITGMDKRL